MNFGHALIALNEGHKVARQGWYDSGMWVVKVEGSTFASDFKYRPGTAYAKHVSLPAVIKPHLDMRCADGAMLCGWVPSQDEMFSDDWSVVTP